MSRRPELAAFAPRRSGRAPLVCQVRSATPADAVAIARLDAERHGGAPEDVLPAIGRELEALASGEQRRCCRVAVLDDEVIAYARAAWKSYDADPAARSVPTGWYLTGLVVSPPHRRAGVGLALTRDRLALLRGRGADEVWYFTSAANRASVALHEKLGFREVARDVVVPRVVFHGGVGVLFRLTLA